MSLLLWLTAKSKASSGVRSHSGLLCCFGANRQDLPLVLNSAPGNYCSSIRLFQAVCDGVDSCGVVRFSGHLQLCVGGHHQAPLHMIPVHTISQTDVEPSERHFRGWLINTKTLLKHCQSPNSAVNARWEGLSCRLESLGSFPSRHLFFAPGGAAAFSAHAAGISSCLGLLH